MLFQFFCIYRYLDYLKNSQQMTLCTVPAGFIFLLCHRRIIRCGQLAQKNNQRTIIDKKHNKHIADLKPNRQNITMQITRE